MRTIERILALDLINAQRSNAAFMKEIGIDTRMKRFDRQDKQVKPKCKALRKDGQDEALYRSRP